jgi:hypothetical protein
MGLIESPIFWVILAAVSEILALIPSDKVRSNSILQLVASALELLLSSKGKKK